MLSYYFAMHIKRNDRRKIIEALQSNFSFQGL